MSAEQLLEQMEVFDKARKDFNEFERSHQTVFKDFLVSFGFERSEVVSIICGSLDSIQREPETPNVISAKNSILDLFQTYRDIYNLQCEKVNQIIENSKCAIEEEAKTSHFEELAKVINEVPMDYYRKVVYTDDNKDKSSTNQTNDEKADTQAQKLDQPSEQKDKVSITTQKPQPQKNLVISTSHNNQSQSGNTRQNKNQNFDRTNKSKPNANSNQPKNPNQQSGYNQKQTQRTPVQNNQTNQKQINQSPRPKPQNINNPPPPPPQQIQTSNGPKAVKIEKSGGGKITITKSTSSKVEINFKSGTKSLNIQKKPK